MTVIKYDIAANRILTVNDSDKLCRTANNPLSAYNEKKVLYNA
jgi:hypothetical protein